MNIRNDALTRLLTLTMRPQTVAGKKQIQVESTMLHFTGEEAETVNIVRDGVTSLSRFSVPCDSPVVSIPIPSIESVLGILPYHGQEVQLSWANDKLEIKSSNKKTTLTASLDAPAFANCPDTLSVWSQKSKDRIQQLEWTDGAYLVTSTGEWQQPIASLTLNTSELFEALRCDAINGQKTNRFTFTCSKEQLKIKVGSELKGTTETTFPIILGEGQPTEVTIEGGLDSVLKHFGNEVSLHFLDFSEFGQGVRILFSLPNGDMVFQAGILG